MGAEMSGQTEESSTAVATLPAQWQRAVEAYRTRKCIVLAPTQIVEIPPYHVPVMTLVEVNPDEKAGDIYPVGGGKFGLTGSLHDRIALAAAITWDSEQCGRTDDGSNPRKISYKMVAMWKDLSGTWRSVPGEKGLDLDAMEDELRQSVPAREWIQKIQDAGKRQQAINETVVKEMIQLRKHLLGRAQTGAKNRAINYILALKSSYTKEELSHGIVVPRLAFRPNYDDPQVRQVLLAVATGTVKELYGAQAALAMGQAQTGNVQPLQIIETRAIAPVGTDEPIKDAETEPPGDGGETGKPEQPPPPDPDEVRFQEAQGDAKKEQEALIRLIARKGYHTEKLLKPLDQFSKEQRAGFLKHLLTMKDVQPPEFPWK